MHAETPARRSGLEHESTSVLVGTALDEPSDEVVLAARELVRAARGRLTVVHALEAPSATPGGGPSGVGRSAERAHERLHAQVARLQLGALGLPVECRIEPGEPDTVLASAAERADADLIVVGHLTSAGALGTLLGGTAERLARRTKRPLLVARDETVLPLRSVLAPVDLSSAGGQALARGLDLLRRFEAGELEVEALHVLDPESLEADRETRRVAQVRQAESEIRHALPRTDDARFAFVPRVLFGRPSREILRRLEERPVDLVLVGSRGAGGLRRALLGSVAADLLREAPCSVLLVSPPASRAALSA